MNNTILGFPKSKYKKSDLKLINCKHLIEMANEDDEILVFENETEFMEHLNSPFVEGVPDYWWYSIK